MRREAAARDRLAAAILLTAALASHTGAPPLAAGEPAAPRTLFVLLDAVPFSLLDELTDPARGEEALFQDFHRPVPLVSTFPSTTSVATVGLLGAAGVARSPGYEARFFDWERHRVRGGGVISYFQIEFPWREFFDWSGKGVARSAFAALTPVKASGRRVRKALVRFMESESPEFFVYVETTDTAAHLKGPDSLAPVFRALDEAIAEAHQRYPDRPFRSVLLSDHGIAGGEPLLNVRKAVKSALRGAGFHFRKRLKSSDDVAWTPFGLVSSFELYVLPERRAVAAEAVAGAEGVDLCVYPEGEGWVIASRQGEARVGSRREGEELLWSYAPSPGDPIGYAPILEALRREAGSEGGVWFSDERWREATARSAYPDALYRIARSFDLIENPASVICSVARGHMFGLALTEAGARLTQGRLRWTHGALHREATWGFLLTDDPAWQPDGPARFSEALIPFLSGRPPAVTTSR